MDVGPFMICSFGTVLLLGDHELSKIMSVVKGSLQSTPFIADTVGTLS